MGICTSAVILEMINQAKSRSAHLKEEVATLQEELANLAKSQAEMDAMRSSEKATFMKNEADLEQGISGVKLALKALLEVTEAAVTNIEVVIIKKDGPKWVTEAQLEPLLKLLDDSAERMAKLREEK